MKDRSYFEWGLDSSFVSHTRASDEAMAQPFLYLTNGSVRRLLSCAENLVDESFEIGRSAY